MLRMRIRWNVHFFPGLLIFRHTALIRSKMAEIVREKFPVLFTPKWPWSLTGSDFTCLEILGCNSRGPSSFSDARLNFRSFADLV